jgi:hypothetical protein
LLDKTVEECAGGEAEVVAPLGVPLDAQDEVRRGAFAGLAPFDGFDDSVLGAARGDAEAVTWDADSLVVAGVDGKAEKVVLLGSLGGVQEGAQERVGRDCGVVGYGDTSAGGMVYGEDCEILYQRASAPDVEELQAKADGENWLVEIVGVLDEEFIHIFPGAVRWRTLWDGFLAVFLRVYIGGTAGKEDGLAGVDEICDGCGRRVEGDFDGGASASLYRDGVLGPRTLVIAEVCTRRHGNGDSGLHGRLIIRLVAVFHVEHLRRD